MYINDLQSILFSSTRSLFVSRSRKSKVHRANSKISYPVRFSTDTVQNNNTTFSFSSLVSFFLFSWVSFVFCVCIIFFETKNIYSDTHCSRLGDNKIFTQPISGSQASFLWPYESMFKANLFFLVRFIYFKYLFISYKNKLKKYKNYFLVIKYFSIIF